MIFPILQFSILHYGQNYDKNSDKKLHNKRLEIPLWWASAQKRGRNERTEVLANNTERVRALTEKKTFKSALSRRVFFCFARSSFFTLEMAWARHTFFESIVE